MYSNVDWNTIIEIRTLYNVQAIHID